MSHLKENEKSYPVWDEALKIVVAALNDKYFNLLFSNVSPVSFAEDTLVLTAPSQHIIDTIRTRHRDLVRDALKEAAGREIAVRFALDSQPVRTSPKDNTRPGPQAAAPGRSATGIENQLPGFEKIVADVPRKEPASVKPRRAGMALNPRYTFDNFVIGESNRFAHAAAAAVAERLSAEYNPLFIYGGVGLGKTHLLQAIAHYALENHHGLKVRYITSEKFTNDFINSVQHKSIAGFQEKYRKIDVLLIDDVQFFAGKEGTQEEFFHTFNTLYGEGKMIILSSDRPPKEINPLEERLRSRFSSGLATDIKPPSLEVRIAILKKKAAVESLNLPGEVYEYIAERIHSNIRELEGAINLLSAFARHHFTNIELATAKDVLESILPAYEAKPASVQLIVAEVCKYFNISKRELYSERRSQTIVFPRQIAMYLAKELTDLTLQQIGKHFGGRDHSTVVHAIQKIENLIKDSEDALRQVQDLNNIIKQKG